MCPVPGIVRALKASQSDFFVNQQLFSQDLICGAKELSSVEWVFYRTDMYIPPGKSHEK
jgi:hypothetical protein